MNVGLARAHGAPCPTAVLDGRTVPGTEAGLLDALAALRGRLAECGEGDVLKNAVVRPSLHPLFDLDYYFVQSLPDSLDSFDLRGSCGHSILAAVEVAARTGMIQPLVPGCRVRVNVLNNGDNVVCEAEASSTSGTRFTAHFLCSPPRTPDSLLTTGEPVTRVSFEGRGVPVSMVSIGNPYVLVPAAELGVDRTEDLFADDPRLFDTMLRLRIAVCEAHGWNTSGSFPKIAALLPDPSGALAVRAVSVPSWHPTVALTGAICLGAAAGVEGSVPWSLARAAGHRRGPLPLLTPGGTVRVSAQTSGEAGDRRLAWVSVAGKQVDYRGPLRPPGSGTAPTTAEPSEEIPWLPLRA